MQPSRCRRSDLQKDLPNCEFSLTDRQHDLLLDGLAERRPALDEQLQLRTRQIMPRPTSRSLLRLHALYPTDQLAGQDKRQDQTIKRDKEDAPDG